MFPDYDSQLLLPIVRIMAANLKAKGKASDVPEIRELGHMMDTYEDAVVHALDCTLSGNDLYVGFNTERTVPVNEDGSRG